MATLNRKKESGCWSIQYDPPGGKRKTITLPKRYDKKTAEDLRDAVTKLLYFRDNSLDYRTEDKRLRTWTETANPAIRQKLADHGLIRIPQRKTAKELWDTFLAQKKGVTQETIDGYHAVKDRFFLFFKPTELIGEYSMDRMLEWKEFLLDSTPLAPTTIAGTIAKAKAVFNWAVGKQKWLEVSPLDGVDKGSYRNKKKDRYITMDEYNRLLDVAICQEWRVIFALARIGGLRAPSEVVRLRWSNVDWEKNRFSIPDGKRKDENGDPLCRTIPLFQELREELETLHERDKEKNPIFVINRYRNPKTNLGTRFADAREAAGLGEIPRPYDNMRASRSIEVDREFGPKLESEWIGHTEKTALDHYFMVTEDDFARAASWRTGKTGD